MWSYFKPLLFFLMIPLTSSATATGTVRRVSVPEEHRLYLACSGTVDLQWRHQVNRIIVTKQGQSVTYTNQQKYDLQPDGSLVIKELEPSDSGDYHCNDQLVADVEVLKGKNFAVSAGRALLLPCIVSNKAKWRWFFRKDSHAKREPILTLFKNGTMKKERKDPQKRFSCDEDGSLQILNLQPGDSGEYLCNGEKAAKVTVLTDHLNIQSTTALMQTDVVGRENRETRPINVVTIIAVIGLCLVVLLVGLLCNLLKGRLRKRRKKCMTGHKQEGTELQTRCLSNLGSDITQSDGEESPSHVEDTEVQYASLGRQNWRERLKVHGDQNHVIYSTVVTARPAFQGLERITH
ncbi:CXADR-like membrane protein isoform X3 [Oncorhynchus mykiss]|uniref:CXADR-like membrane protein isoform X3 n=1 Tax=Oncorhynchus mykiss TaxID=8022 RepID=UPI001878738E|nr:CXADR-like membrane protein isoform X3 [Oncorhynchus mykiss]